MEVFMARRHIKSDFAPDVFVFPGGKASEDDVPMGDRFELSTEPELIPNRVPSPGWPGVFLAAIRELFEEAGILLARRASGDLQLHGSSENESIFSGYRERVRAGSMGLADLALKEDLTYCGDSLHLFSNWITPAVLTKRFDTFFFVTEKPAFQEPYHADLHELTDSLWIRPEDALDRFQAGLFPLVFATERHLERLAKLGTLEAVLDATTQPVETTCPRWTDREGERVFLTPEDAGYEDAETA